MGKESKIRFIIRSILFIILIIFFIRDNNIILSILNYKIIFNIKIYHIIWLYLVLEMIFLIIPYTNNHSYNGKLFAKHYIEVENYNKEKLDKYIDKHNKQARRVLIVWTLFNLFIYAIYKKYNLSKSYVFLVFMFYYWLDMFCVNIWCPFHKLFFKSKCCNECRIYNWDHVMLFTPLVFIKSFWTYSLFVLSLFVFFQWEYMIKVHPERFSPVSNKKLQCKYCNYNCRFNKIKKSKNKNIK